MTERELARKKAAARKARMERERKKRNRRVVTTVALMLAVCVASIGGTIAWLTDSTENVVNTFNTSDISIWMTETVNGELKTTTATEGITNGNFKMVPGLSEPKDPNVVVGAGSEDCWVFVKVKEAGGVVEVNGKNTEFSDFITYTVDTANWTELSGVTLNAGEKVYYTYCRDLTANRSIKVLLNQQVSYPNTITKEMMNKLTDSSKPSLTFEAYAIQMANGNDTEFIALEAWNELNPSNSGEGSSTPEGSGN